MRRGNGARTYYPKSEDKQERSEIRQLKCLIKKLEKDNKRLVNEIKQVTNALHKSLATISELTKHKTLVEILTDLENEELKYEKLAKQLKDSRNKEDL